VIVSNNIAVTQRASIDFELVITGYHVYHKGAILGVYYGYHKDWWRQWQLQIFRLSG